MGKYFHVHTSIFSAGEPPASLVSGKLAGKAHINIALVLTYWLTFYSMWISGKQRRHTLLFQVRPMFCYCSICPASVGPICSQSPLSLLTTLVSGFCGPGQHLFPARLKAKVHFCHPSLTSPASSLLSIMFFCPFLPLPAGLLSRNWHLKM